MRNLILAKEGGDDKQGKQGKANYLQPVRDKINKFAKKRSIVKANKRIKKSQARGDEAVDIIDEDHVLDSDSWPSSLPQTLSMVLAMTWHDYHLKDAFIENPMEVARALGIKLPEGVSLYVDEVRGKCRVTIYEYNPETGKHKRGMSLKLNLIAGV